MKQFAVIGHPIAHSKSPLIHQTFAKQLNIELSYTLLESEPEQFKQTVDKFFAEGGEEDPNAEENPEEEKKSNTTPLDTINGDVAKRHDGFLKALSYDAKEKVFNDFMANADPEIQNLSS